ncbi:phytanoyl-CoA dioxygenase family protein [Paenibacillus sp. GXUN7292]|uniref:phytanoyl-CoA dioxygenase family protein n=1 Tax=Paenibacillus sp. GXUN7292 TaxID=3422499 RepID=UPI003D7D1AE8
MKNYLEQSKIEFYKENGFVQVDNILTEEELDELSEFLEEAMTQEGTNSFATSAKGGSYYKVLNQKVNVWRDHGGMSRYSFHPKLAQIAMELTGAKGIRVFHDHGLWKMPQDSKPTAWHQDFPYWPMTEPGALSVWIPMHDVDEHNGCMMFVPGSHKIGKLTGIDLANPQDIYEQIEGTELEKTKPVKIPLKKGSCTFHDGLTFHFAHANNSDEPRRVLAIIFMPDGTVYSGKSHPVTDNAGLEAGKPFGGGLFPLVARRK